MVGAVGGDVLVNWGNRRQLTVFLALLGALIVIWWSGGDGQTGNTAFRPALALGLAGLGLVYAEAGQVQRTRSSSLLSRGAVIVSVVAIAVPIGLSWFEADLTRAEVTLVGSIVGLWCLVVGSRAREGRSRARGAPMTSGYLLVLIVALLWVIVSTLPFPTWAQDGLDILAAVTWGVGGLVVLSIGFRSDDEVVSTLGIAVLGVAASQVLTMGGVYEPAAGVIGLAAVAFAIASGYVELKSGMEVQRLDLASTKERARDLAHEARTAITAIEATLFGLDRMVDDDSDDHDDLRTALALELQSLRLMLTREQPQPLESFRVADVLRPLIAATGNIGVALHWLVSPRVVGRFAKGALVEITQCLLENARVHGNAGNVTVEVEMDAQAIQIRVVDDGEGVDETIAPRLFERGAKRRGSPGKGLGLYLARDLARAHGGELAYEAAVTQRSSFVLTIPSDGRVVDLSVYEDDQVLQPLDGDGPTPETPTSDGHRRDAGLARKSHSHRRSEPGGEMTGV